MKNGFNSINAGKFESNMGLPLDQNPKQIISESPRLFRVNQFGEDNRDYIIGDHECNSLKIPSLVEFNLSNPSGGN